MLLGRHTNVAQHGAKAKKMNRKVLELSLCFEGRRRDRGTLETHDNSLNNSFQRVELMHLRHKLVMRIVARCSRSVVHSPHDTNGKGDFQQELR